MKIRIKKIYSFFKQVIDEFSNDNILKYSASLSYYTIFSLAPILIIIISVCGVLFGKEAIQGQIYVQIKDLVGNEAAIQIQEILKNIHLTKGTRIATIISVISLILGSTGMFVEIQDSLNKIFGLKPKPKLWWKLILNQLLSFGFIIILGLLMIISLVLNALVALLGKHLEILAGMKTIVISLISQAFSLSITILLFTFVFKLLPDAKIKWKDIFLGAILTSLLFELGKWAIGYYLEQTNLTTVYGAAGSILIIMVWAYYNSVILYLGAEFTKIYSKNHGNKILPNNFSMKI